MTSAIKIVRQFRGLKISSPECNGLLRKILYGDNFCTSLKDYHKHAQRFIDILDAVSLAYVIVACTDMRNLLVIGSHDGYKQRILSQDSSCFEEAVCRDDIATFYTSDFRGFEEDGRFSGRFWRLLRRAYHFKHLLF